MWRHSRREDVVLALFYGLVAAALGWIGTYFVRTDLAILLRASELFLAGGDPYRGLVATTGYYFYYPLPVAIVLAPLTAMPLQWAAALLMGVSGGLLAYGLMRHGRIAFFVLAGPSMLFACRLGQWSPLITAAVLLPGFGIVYSFKPTLGVACLSGWPRPGAIAAGLALAFGTLLLLPEWPWLWIESTRNMPLHPAPIGVAGGAILLAALSRWRRPEARLLFVLACCPQVFLFADQLPLALVARSKREQMVQWVVGWIGVVAAYRAHQSGEQLMVVAQPYIIWTLYVPALIMVLRRPNEGVAPAWLDRRLTGAPRWIRGRPAPEAA